MKPSALFRISVALGLCSALGGAAWQLRPQSGDVVGHLKSAPARSGAGMTPADSAHMEHQVPEPAVALSVKPVPVSEPGSTFKSVMAGLQPQIDAALRASDYPAAHQVVDEALASSGLQGMEKQRLMVSKLGFLGMKGDHAGMLALMNEIIAVDPASPLARTMADQRAIIEKIANRGPDDPGMCSTCSGMHGDGEAHLPQP